jgi:hypothetical protein
MSEFVFAAWFVVAVCVVAAVVAAVAQPLRWERSVAAALVLGGDRGRRRRVPSSGPSYG